MLLPLSFSSQAPLERRCISCRSFRSPSFLWHRWLACTPIGIFITTIQSITTMSLGRPATSCRISTKARPSLSELRATYLQLSFADRFPCLSGWDFFTQPDPTHGNVIYEPQANAQDLAYVQSDGTAVLKVDNTTNVAPGGNRRSYVSVGRLIGNQTQELTTHFSRIASA